MNRPSPAVPYNGLMPYGAALPAQSASPQRAGLIARVWSALNRPLGRPAPTVTTEGGVAGSASPSVSGYSRLPQTYVRREIMADLWQLYGVDPRFRASVEKHCAKATRGGFKVAITSRPGTAPRQATRAQAEAEEMLRRVNLLLPDDKPNVALLAKLLRHGRMEADLFLQHVIAWDAEGSGGSVVKLKVMPASGMERLTDDTDEFYDPARAFVQVDTQAQRPVKNADGTDAYFPAYAIGHHRWKQLGEDRYGQFEYNALRQTARGLSVLEQAQEVRRISNASRIEDHTVGVAGESDPKAVEEYQKNIAGFGAEEAGVNPYHQSGKYVHDGNVKVDVHPSDPSVHEIGDLLYFLDKESVATGVPLQLLGANLVGVPRDTLNLVVAEWLDGMAYDVAWVYGVILEIICLQLRLRGIAPESLSISLSVPERVFESAADAVAFVNKMMSNTLGAGMNAKPYPLLTPEAAVAILAEYIGTDDSEKYVARLEKMLADKHMDADTVHEMQISGADSGVQTGATNVRGGGQAASGGGTRFENGKRTDGASKPAGGEAYKPKP